MKRIPSGLAILLLLPAAAGVIAVSILAGPTKAADLTRDIVMDYRLPRGILAFLVGASLGASGVCFQGLFRNSLADPFVVGRLPADQLKAAREAKGLSLADVTKLTGMDRSAVSKLETGQRANPTVETLVRYAEAVGKRVAVSLTDAHAT